MWVFIPRRSDSGDQLDDVRFTTNIWLLTEPVRPLTDPLGFLFIVTPAKSGLWKFRMLKSLFYNEPQVEMLVILLVGHLL
jgi:hypothetical protein